MARDSPSHTDIFKHPESSTSCLGLSVAVKQGVSVCSHIMVLALIQVTEMKVSMMVFWWWGGGVPKRPPWGMSESDRTAHAWSEPTRTMLLEIQVMDSFLSLSKLPGQIKISISWREFLRKENRKYNFIEFHKGEMLMDGTSSI